MRIASWTVFTDKIWSSTIVELMMASTAIT